MSPLALFLLATLALTGLHLLGLQLSLAAVTLSSPLELQWKWEGLLPLFLWFALPTALAQAAVLALPIPEASKGSEGASLRARAVAGALALTVAAALPVFALSDLPFWLDAEVGPLLGKAIFWGLVAGLALTWIGFSLLLTHQAKGKPDQLERRVAQATAGTLVGLALATPWYLVLRRKQQCFCALGTFWALLVGLWSLVLVGGPMLLWLARERRTRAALRG